MRATFDQCHCANLLLDASANSDAAETWFHRTRHFVALDTVARDTNVE